MYYKLVAEDAGWKFVNEPVDIIYTNLHLRINKILHIEFKLPEELLKKIETGIVKKQDTLENQVKQSYLAIGSNLGNKITNINMAMFELEKNKSDINLNNVSKEISIYKLLILENEEVPQVKKMYRKPRIRNKAPNWVQKNIK